MKAISFIISFFCLLFLSNVSTNAQLSKFGKWQEPSYFKGFNMSVWDNNDQREVNQLDFDSLKAIGANLVVINTQGSMSVESPYGPNIYYQEGDLTIYHIDMLDSMVNFARNSGLMYVIVVRDGPGRIDVSQPGNSTIWTNPTEQKLYGKMLVEMTKRYLPDTLFIGLNMIEEPNPLGELWEPPIPEMDSSLKANGIDVNSLYSLLIDSVRKLDNDLPLIVGGVHANHPEYFSLVRKQADQKIVYVTHLYNPGEFSHNDQAYSADYPGDYWCVRLQEVSTVNKTFMKESLYKPVRDFQDMYKVPVLIGEFGIRLPQNGGDQYLKDIGNIGCELGWHYVLWGFNNGPAFNYKDLDSIYGTNYYSTVKGLMKCESVDAEEIKTAAESITITPNPVEDFIEIRKSSEGFIKIYNTLGECVMVEQTSSSVQRIDVSGLSAGLYFVRIGAEVRKFIKL